MSRGYGWGRRRPDLRAPLTAEEVAYYRRRLQEATDLLAEIGDRRRARDRVSLRARRCVSAVGALRVALENELTDSAPAERGGA